MDLSRRKLLKMSGMGLGAILFAGCAVPEEEFIIESPHDLPEDLVEGTEAHYATFVNTSSGYESILVRVMQGRAKKVEGNPAHPTSRGKHSARAEASLQSLYHPDRINGPMKKTGGSFQSITWDEAIETLSTQVKNASGNAAIITGPDASIRHKVVNQFAKDHKLDHHIFESLENTNLMLAINNVFGQNQLPNFDFQNSNYILSFGADFLGTWSNSVFNSWQYGNFRQGHSRDKRGTLVHIEPRLSLTAANADEWFYNKPGSEGVIALTIASIIIDEGSGDPEASSAVSKVLTSSVRSSLIENVEQKTGISLSHIKDIAHSITNNSPAIIVGAGLAGAHTNGEENLTAIYLLNALAGNIGKSGGIQFNPEAPLTDLITQSNTTTISEWGDISNAMKNGQVKLALIHNANPVYGLPESLNFKNALESVSYVVSFSTFMDETTAQADLILPDHTSLESWNLNVSKPGPGYQTIGVQQPIVMPETNSADFGDVLLTITDRLGKKPIWDSVKSGVIENAKTLQSISLNENRGNLVTKDDGSFDLFWVSLLQNGGWWDIQNKASVEFSLNSDVINKLGAISDPEFSGSSQNYPFHLLPFESQGIGEGSGAHLPWLQGIPDPISTAVWDTWVEINPSKASELGLREGDIVTIESSHGSIDAKIYIHPATSPEVLSIPIGQGHKGYGRYATDRGSNVLSILSPIEEKNSGALAWGATRVRLTPTGSRKRLPKSEGAVEARALPGFPVVQVTNH
tara:strand:- start:41658 stop:43895 length:2238 start_codon:yes stop_codon:yes gene_type:complete